MVYVRCTAKSINSEKGADIAMKRLLVLVVSFVLVASVAWAANFSSLMTEGKTALDAKDYVKAENSFRAALAETPDSTDAELYLGVTLSRKGDKAQYKEAESHLKHALMATPQDPLTNFELGTLFYNRAVPDEARDFFENVIAYAPGSELARKAEEKLRSMEHAEAAAPAKATAGKRWALAVAVGEQYDSNVVLKTRTGELPKGIDKQSDWRSLVNFTGGVNFLSAGPVNGSLGYSFYQSMHSTLTDYDVQSHTAKLGFSYDITSRVKTGLVGSYDYMTLGTEKYSESGTVQLATAFDEGAGNNTLVELKYRDLTLYNVEVQEDNRDKSGKEYTLGVAQVTKFGEAVSAKVGFVWGKFDARTDLETYDLAKVFGVIEAELPMESAVALSTDYTIRNYRYEKESEADKFRNDREFEVGVSVRKELLRWLSAEAGVSYTYNASNLSEFEYNRTVTGVLLKARF